VLFRVRATLRRRATPADEHPTAHAADCLRVYVHVLIDDFFDSSVSHAIFFVSDMRVFARLPLSLRYFHAIRYRRYAAFDFAADAAAFSFSPPVSLIALFTFFQLYASLRQLRYFSFFARYCQCRFLRLIFFFFAATPAADTLIRYIYVVTMHGLPTLDDAC